MTDVSTAQRRHPVSELDPFSREFLNNPHPFHEELREAETLLNELVALGSFDAVKQLSEVYPLKVFPDAVGLGPEGRGNLLNAFGPRNSCSRTRWSTPVRFESWGEGSALLSGRQSRPE